MINVTRKTQLVLVLTGLILCGMIPIQIYADELEIHSPTLANFQTNYCSKAPYNCKFDGTIQPSVFNEYYAMLYAEVERYFVNSGFEFAIIEYCFTYPESSYCYESLEPGGAKRLRDTTRVGETDYVITQIFPDRSKWYEAFGGENTKGLYFYKSIDAKEFPEYCQSEVLVGERNDYQSQEGAIFFRMLIADIGEIAHEGFASVTPECFVTKEVLESPYPLHVRLGELTKDVRAIIYKGKVPANT